LITHKLGPSLDVDLLIILAAKSKIAVIGGDFLGRCQIGSVGDAQGNVS
jgi:hypothetical protein